MDSCTDDTDCRVNTAKANPVHLNVSRGTTEGCETCLWDGAGCPGKQGHGKEVFSVSGCQLLIRYQGTKTNVHWHTLACIHRGLYPAEGMLLYLCV